MSLFKRFNDYRGVLLVIRFHIQSELTLFNRIQSGKYLRVVLDETPHFDEDVDDFDTDFNRRVTAEDG